MTDDDLQPEPVSEPAAAEAAPMSVRRSACSPTHRAMSPSGTSPTACWAKPDLHRLALADPAGDAGPVRYQSSHRKAILRKTEKALQRTVKAGLSRLDERQMEHVHWNAFILMVDKALGNQHLKIRTDEGLCDQLIDQAPGLAAPAAA